MTASEVLFVYGTLMDPDQVVRLLGHGLESGVATAPGFCRATLPGLPYPFAVEAPAVCIDGRLLRGLSRLDLDRLDAYERTDHHLFIRRRVKVQVMGQAPEAWMYVGGPSLLRRWMAR